MRKVLPIVVLLALVLPIAACGGQPETRLPGWEEAGFRPPFSYESTRCFDACAEQIARLKAEEAAAKKKAEEEAAAKATVRTTTRRSSSVTRRSSGDPSAAGAAAAEARRTAIVMRCSRCGVGMDYFNSAGMCWSCMRAVYSTP